MLTLTTDSLNYSEGVKSYATPVATYVASFTLVHVLLKAADVSLETVDGLLKWTANEKVHTDCTNFVASYNCV